KLPPGPFFFLPILVSGQ
ncbi:unnamed protein product, partial [Allacma fusca]